jgi:hypothetical protein
MDTAEWMRELGTPPDVVARQLRWERHQQLLRARQSGLTMRQVGDWFGLSWRYVPLILATAKRRTRPAPLQLWLSQSNSAQVLGSQIAAANLSSLSWSWSVAAFRVSMRWRHKYA